MTYDIWWRQTKRNQRTQLTWTDGWFLVEDGRLNYNLNQILHLLYFFNDFFQPPFCNYWLPFLLHLQLLLVLLLFSFFFLNSTLMNIFWFSPHKSTIFKITLGQRESIPNPSSQANSSTNIYSLFPLSLRFGLVWFGLVWLGFSGLERDCSKRYSWGRQAARTRVVPF